MDKKDKKKDKKVLDDDAPEDYDSNRTAIEALCRVSPNNICADCGTNGTRWVSVNHGVFVCIRCSGIHRSVGVHVTKVKSTNLDKWTRAEIEVMRQIGNARGKEMWEAKMTRGVKPPTMSDTDAVVKSYILQKYEDKAFAVEGWADLLKKIYKNAGYKSGKKALKDAQATSPKADAPASPAFAAAPAAADAKKAKKVKKIYGAFGLVTVPADEHDAKLTALLGHFGLEVEAVPAEAA